MIYQCHVGTATPEGTFDSLIERAAAAASAGRQRHRTAARGRVPWQPQLGLRRRRPVRAVARLRRARRRSSASSTPPTSTAWASSWTSSTTTSAPTGTTCASFRPTTSPIATTRRGARRSTTTVRAASGSASWCSTTRAYWLHEYHADGLRLDATHAIYDDSNPHLLAELTETCAPSLPDRTPDRADRRDARKRRALSASRSPRAGSASTRCGPTTFTTRCAAILRGDHEGYYANYAGTLEEVARCIEQGWLYIGQPTPSSELREAARHAGAATARPGSSCTSCRTTTRSATAPSANGCITRSTSSATEPRRRCCCFCRTRRCCSWARSSARRRRFSTSPTTTPSWAGWSPRAAAENSRRFRHSPIRRARERIPDPQAESTFLSVEAAAARGRDPARVGHPARCTSSCSSCGAPTSCWSTRRASAMQARAR